MVMKPFWIPFIEGHKKTKEKISIKPQTFEIMCTDLLCSCTRCLIRASLVEN